MTTRYGNFRYIQEALVERLYDYKDVSNKTIELELLQKKNLIIRTASQWMKKILSWETSMGVYLPHISITENSNQVEAYYAKSENGYIYFITPDNLYHYKTDKAIGIHLFGSTPILPKTVHDISIAKELILEMDIYMRYRGVTGKAKLEKRGK